MQYYSINVGSTVVSETSYMWVMMGIESASMSSLPWLWVIEALACSKQVDVLTLNDMVTKAPKVCESVGKDAKEIVALRCLENLFDSSNEIINDLPSAPGSKIGFDSLESCEVVLGRIMSEVPTSGMRLARSDASKWDARPFIMHKRANLTKCALQQLKDTILEGTHPLAVNLRERSGLACRIQCHNRTYIDGVDVSGTNHQVAPVNGNFIPSTSSHGNENGALQSTPNRALWSSKRCRDESAHGCNKQNEDDHHLSLAKKSKQELAPPCRNGEIPQNHREGRNQTQELQSVSLERDLSSGLVHDRYVSPYRVEQSSDVHEYVQPTDRNGCDSNKESLAARLERERYSEGVHDDYVSPNWVERCSDVNDALNQCDQNILADKSEGDNEFFVEPDTSSASTLKGKQQYIPDDDFENNGDLSIPLEGPDRFLLDDPEDGIPLQEHELGLVLGQPDASSIPLEESEASIVLEKANVSMPFQEPRIDIPREEPNISIPIGEPELSIPLEEPDLSIPLEEPNVVAPTDESNQMLDGNEIEDGAELHCVEETSSDYDGSFCEEIDVVARKNDFLSSQYNLSEDSLATADWTEFCLCMKCSGDGQLLHCSSASCPVVVHENCLGSPASFDEEGNFYCPFCAYSHALSEYLEAKKKASSERKKLTAFIGLGHRTRTLPKADRHKKKKRQLKQQVDSNLFIESHGNANLREKEGSQANHDREHSSRVSDYNIRKDKDNKLHKEPTIPCVNETLSHKIDTGTSGRTCQAEDNKVHDPEPLEVVEGRENQPAAGLEGDDNETMLVSQTHAEADSPCRPNTKETSKYERSKPVKSNYSIRFQKQKKKYTYPEIPLLRRKKVAWTTAEEEMLKEGVIRFSTAGETFPWTTILDFGGTVFKKRSAMDLKDKWRNICKRPKQK